MKEISAGVIFSIPYEIAVVRPLKQTTLEERERALRAAYYNTELIPQELIYIDLKTDSGVSWSSPASITNAADWADLAYGAISGGIRHLYAAGHSGNGGGYRPGSRGR